MAQDQAGTCQLRVISRQHDATSWQPALRLDLCTVVAFPQASHSIAVSRCGTRLAVAVNSANGCTVVATDVKLQASWCYHSLVVRTGWGAS